MSLAGRRLGYSPGFGGVRVWLFGVYFAGLFREWSGRFCFVLGGMLSLVGNSLVLFFFHWGLSCCFLGVFRPSLL